MLPRFAFLWFFLTFRIGPTQPSNSSSGLGQTATRDVSGTTGDDGAMDNFGDTTARGGICCSLWLIAVSASESGAGGALHGAWEETPGRPGGQW